MLFLGEKNGGGNENFEYGTRPRPVEEVRFFPVVKFICTTESDTDSYRLGKETFIKWPADSVSKI